MKLLPCLSAMMLVASFACSKAEHEPHPNDVLAAEHARRDAERVIAAPAGSMQREHAILHIHATQEAILQAGDTAAAAVYGDTARAVLRRATVIE